MTFPLMGYIGGGALLAGALAGWTVRDWKADSDEAEAERKAFTQYTAMTEALADASLSYEVLAQNIRTSERKDRETIREIYRDKIIPAECAVPADAVSLLDNAIERANAATSRQFGGTLPDAP
jgi:hypothetical protein